MGFIKNFDELSTTPERKIVLELIEEAFASIQPQNVMTKNFVVDESTLKLLNNNLNLPDYNRIFLVGFGKGSAGIAKIIEQKLGEKLTKGFVIDTEAQNFEKIEFTKGTHPLPSQQNIDFTDKVVSQLSNLSEKDLVLVVICGGGSAMFESPAKINLEKLIETNHQLLKNGADIFETNTIRKHLSKVKGGGLAKILNPAKVCSLIFSDVPGNDLSTIASGTTVKDSTSVEDALSVVKKFGMNLTTEDFTETPKDEVYFKNVDNILMLSNLTALNAMKEKAENMNLKAEILTDKFQGVAKDAGKELLAKAKSGIILLAGGETTVVVNNPQGVGGRNQEVVLGSIQYLQQDTVIASFDSDGWDNSEFAGAIADGNLSRKAREMDLDAEKYLNENNSLEFFNHLGDAINTGRLPSNVSDLFIVYKT